MALLIQPATGLRFTLAARTLVGRSTACALTLKNPRVSNEHAVIFYDAARGWGLRDLGSRNGTRVDGHAVPVGDRHRLEVGQELLFGDDHWIVDDIGPPVATACAPDGRRRRARGGLLALPDPDDPQATIYLGPDRRWILEHGETLRVVLDGEILELDGVPWQLELPRPTELAAGGAGGTTVDDTLPLALSTVRAMHVAVSRDQETIEITLRFPDAEVLLQHRSHHYLLFVLARARITDREAGIEPAEQGWMYVEDVCREVGITPERMYVEVFRARRHVADQGVPDAVDLFERRTHTRQIRLGVAPVTIGPL